MILPLCPRLAHNRWLVPLVLLCGRDCFLQYGACFYGRDPFVGYWEQHTRRLFLTVFDMVNVFGHPWILSPPFLHDLLEVHGVNVFEAPYVC